MTFEYQARSRFDVEQRIGQNCEGGKVPKADDETRCQTPGCGHAKWSHCKKFRRGEKPRGYLWVWNFAQPRMHYPVKCKHFDPSRPFDVPMCDSTACAVSDCGCSSFLSPYRKPRAKQPPKSKTPAKPRKRNAKATAQQDFEFESAPS
jgi:hypothetical protein